MLQLGIQSQDDDDVDITVDEAWNNIVERIKYIFSDEVSTGHKQVHSPKVNLVFLSIGINV